MTLNQQKKIEHTFLFINGLLIVVLLHLVGKIFPLRIDVTEEKRHSISYASKELLRSLDDKVFIEVYLDGELPSGMKRFQKSIQTLLEEFQIYGKENIQFVFKDPSIAASQQSQNTFYKHLIQKGLQPTNLTFKKNDNRIERLIFPGCIISYSQKERAVNLLKGNKNNAPDEILNQSIENIEYNLASAIKTIVQNNVPRIGIVADHHSMDSIYLEGFYTALQEKFIVRNLNLSQQNDIINGYDVLIIIKPTIPFEEKEKYYLDQYLIRGGKLMFFIDALRVNMDSIDADGTYSFPVENGLEDMLFKYGVRINQNFVLDVSCSDIPIVAGNVGNQPRMQMLPWPFFPVISKYSEHSIVKNLDIMQLRFVSTIDTVKAMGIHKTPLLFTSPYSRILNAPVLVRIQDVQGGILPQFFNSPSQPVSYLLEGKFQSFYKNRIPRGVNNYDFLSESQESKILVVSDGDFVRNEINPANGKSMEWGYDPYLKVQYASKDFLFNALDYCIEKDGLILSRNKSIKQRYLDTVKVKQYRNFIQIINIATPLSGIILFGICFWWGRKKKWGK